jgi:hypothetical protein
LYFSRIFKKEKGLSATEYRENVKKSWNAVDKIVFLFNFKIISLDFWK